MLLRVGVIMMVLSLTLAAGVAATVVGFRDEAPETTAVSSVQPRAAETTVTPERKPDRDETLEIDDEKPQPRPKKTPASREKVQPKKPTPRETPEPREIPKPQPEELKPAPLPMPDLPQPTSEERTFAQEPRYYEPDPGADMSLTVEALGLYDVPIVSSDNLETLDTSLMHVPETSFPWDEGEGRNVFVAGHYLGYPGTASRLVFYNLDKLREGDEVVLADSGGRTYRYRVSESFSASPDESWVMGQEVGRDMLTLQTCIPPGFEERLIVRADRV